MRRRICLWLSCSSWAASFTVRSRRGIQSGRVPDIPTDPAWARCKSGGCRLPRLLRRDRGDERAPLDRSGLCVAGAPAAGVGRRRVSAVYRATRWSLRGLRRRVGASASSQVLAGAPIKRKFCRGKMAGSNHYRSKIRHSGWRKSMFAITADPSPCLARASAQNLTA